MSAAKRRRLDLETNSGGSTTGPAARSMGSRQRAAAASKAANAAQSAAAAAAVAASGNGRYGNENGPYVPIVSSTLSSNCWSISKSVRLCQCRVLSSIVMCSCL